MRLGLLVSLSLWLRATPSLVASPVGSGDLSVVEANRRLSSNLEDDKAGDDRTAFKSGMLSFRVSLLLLWSLSLLPVFELWLLLL